MKYKILLCLFLIHSGVNGQEVLNTLSFYDDGNDGFNAGPLEHNNMYKDKDDLYIMFKDVGGRDLWFGGQLVEHIPSSDPDLEPWEYHEDYIARINDEMEVEDVLYVRNCRYINDYAAHNKKLYISVSSDTLDIMIKDTMFRFENVNSHGILVINEDMELERVLHFGPNRITRIEANERGLFYTAQIPDYTTHMLVGQDTVYNYYDGDISNPGQQTQVLIHYDLEQDSFMWHHRFGSSAREYMSDMVLDGSGNIILTGRANAINWLTFNDIDSLESNATGGSDEYFVAKFSGEDGENLWAEVTDQVIGDVLISLYIGENEDVYIQGSYFTDESMYGDTILYDYNELTDFRSSQRAMLLKLNSDGEFQWAYQIDGDIHLTKIFRMIEIKDENLIALTAVTSLGEFSIQNKDYVDTNDSRSVFVLFLNRETGEIVRHYGNQTENHHTLPFIDVNTANNLRVLVVARDDVTVFGQDFFGLEGLHYHLLEISPLSLVDVKDEFQNEVLSSIYPNPIKQGGLLTVTVERNIAIDELSIFTVDGKLLNTWDGINASEFQIKLEVPQSGAYVLKVQTKQGVESKIIYIE